MPRTNDDGKNRHTLYCGESGCHRKDEENSDENLTDELSELNGKSLEKRAIVGLEEEDGRLIGKFDREVGYEDARDWETVEALEGRAWQDLPVIRIAL